MSAPTLTTIPTKQIAPSADNPRGEIDRSSEEFAGLCVSIKSVGILQPILITAANGDDKHTVLDGHRRHAAALEAKLSEIPAMVLPDGVSEKVARLTANIQREDFSPVAEARAIKELQEEGLTQVQAADALGKSERWVRERLRLVTLPEKAQEAFDAGAIPLEALVGIQKIAEQAPQAASAIAERAIAEREQPGEGLERLNLARGNELIAALENTIEEDDAGTGAAGSLFELAYQVKIEDLRHFGIPDDKLKAFEARFKEINELDHWRRVEFGEQDSDDARAYGCLLELDGENHLGKTISRQYITDRDWLIDRVDQLLARTLEAAKELAKERGGEPTKAKPEKGSKEEKAEKARRRKAREAELEKRAAVRAANLELGQRVAKALKAPKLTLEEAKVLALMAVGAIRSDLGGRGLIYCFHDFQNEEKLNNGSTRVTYENGRVAGEALIKSILAAKSPEAALGAALQSMVLARYADQECVTESSRSWWGVPGHNVPSEVKQLLERAAEKRGVLPDSIRLGVQQHRRQVAEEGELALLGAMAKSRAKAGVVLGALLRVPQVDENVLAGAIDAKRLKEHETEDEPTYTLTAAGKKRLEKLKATEKERRAGRAGK